MLLTESGVCADMVVREGGLGQKGTADKWRASPHLCAHNPVLLPPPCPLIPPLLAAYHSHQNLQDQGKNVLAHQLGLGLK